MSVESYIGHFNYGLAYYMINFNTFTEDGKSVGVFMTDGIGSQYSFADRATADQITYDGKVYKLDQSRLDFKPLNLMAPIKAETISEGKHFESNSCKLSYTASYEQAEGVDLVLLTHRRDVTYGYFHGFCEVEGVEVQINKAWGFFELVYTRL